MWHAACVFGFALIIFFGTGEFIRAFRGHASWQRAGSLAVAAGFNLWGFLYYSVWVLDTAGVFG